MTTNLTPEEQELEAKIDLLTNSRINLRVSAALFNLLLKQADFHGISIEEHCKKILEDSLKTQIGAATIKAPSHLSGSTARTVVAPSSVSTVTRA